MERDVMSVLRFFIPALPYFNCRCNMLMSNILTINNKIRLKI